MRYSFRAALAGLLGVLTLAACGAAPTPVAEQTVEATATFGTKPGTAITYDTALVPPGARATVESTSRTASTVVTLRVEGLVPQRSYGAHAHTEPCGAAGADAGPHYQDRADPVQPSVDPNYANPSNEIWLDLATDNAGAGTARTTVAWAFAPDRRAHSVVIHAMPTATDAGHAGTAGDRAACITVPF